MMKELHEAAYVGQAAASDQSMTIFEFLVIIAIIGIAIAINVALASNMCKIASNKGYDPHELHIFAWCFWLPPFGYLYVIALPNLNIQSQNAKLIQQNEEIIKLLGSKTGTTEETK